jgi:hypothetical protein
MVEQVGDKQDEYFCYFSTVLKCVKLCGDGATHSWLFGAQKFDYASLCHVTT